MKLYPKKLDSLEALKREKIRLRYERKHISASDLNPISEIGRGKASGAAQTGLLATVIALVSSQTHLKSVITIGRPLLKLIRKRRSRMEANYVVAGSQKRSFAKRVITDIAISYIIGKALQVSVKGIRLYMRRKKARPVVVIK